MRKKQFLILFLVMVMVASVMGSEALSEEGIEALSEEEINEELYSMLPDTSLSGVFDPDALKDRTDIDKALPFKPKDPDNVVIGFTEIVQSDPWFVAIKESAEKRAEKYGYTLHFDNAQGRLHNQGSHVDSYITRGVDIIIVDPVDVVGATSYIQRAVDAGIPVIGIGSQMYGAPVITTITGNTFENGFASGEYTAKQFGANEQINLAIVIGMMGNSTAESRVNGMLSGLIYGRAEKQGKDLSKNAATLTATKLFKEGVVKTGKFNSDEWQIACLGWGEGKWTEEGGLKATEDLLSANQDRLNLILAENDFQGAGAVKALENRDLQEQIKIACPGNGMRREVEMVKEGKLLTTGSHNSWAFAEAAIDMIHDLAEGTNSYDANNLPTLTAFKAFSINKDTVDKYWDPDESNLYHKTPPLKIRTVPELKEALEDGSYYAVQD